MTYIWEREDWPNFKWSSTLLIKQIQKISFLQGKLLGQMVMGGLEDKQNRLLSSLSEEIQQSADIEGESFPLNEVRSSLANRLGIEQAGIPITDHRIEGTVQLILDAVQNYEQPLTEERLLRWQAALFPGGVSGVKKILTAQWRDDAKGPMQVISGSMGKEIVHYQAPGAEHIPGEVQRFLQWFNEKTEPTDWLIKSALAHLWFVTLHPFEDGNGRITRIISEMALARFDQSSNRYYSMSGGINKNKKDYYLLLEKTQKGNMDCTEWVLWYLQSLEKSLNHALEEVEKIKRRKAFWDRVNILILNQRQRSMLQRLTTDFKGHLTSHKWAVLCKCSQDTAGRDINDLIRRKILIKAKAGGRSTHYLLDWDGTKN